MKDLRRTSTPITMLPVTLTERGLSMNGGIYSSETCPICGGPLVDNGFTAVACKKHPDQIARKLRVRLKRKGECTQKQFTCQSGLESYKLARRFIDGLRFKIDENTFDHRDYKVDNPLGFSNLMDKWLAIKEKELTPESYRPLKLYGRTYAGAAWGDRNIKTITFADLEDFLTITLGHLSSKSRNNAKSVLHDFFAWLRRRKYITFDQLPEFPVIDVTMGFRQLVDKETQLAILDKLKDLTWATNPRIWICAKWLSTYFSIRPKEMLSLKEKHIDLKIGVFFVQPDADKVGQGKIIEMLPEDVELARSLPRGFPDMPFFRHLPEPTRYGITERKKQRVAGAQFRHDYLAAWWKRACAEVGVTGVSLYPGTKHSSVTALGEEFTPEQIQKASQISTNKAFSRYFRPNPALVRSIYTAARGDTERAGGDTNVTPKVSNLKPAKPR